MQNQECRMPNESKPKKAGPGQGSPVLCLVRDLLFYSKIRAAAGSAGIEIKSIRNPVKLTSEIGCALIVDLNQPDALSAAAAWRLQTQRPVIGFVSHVDTETINAARAAGISRILARSQLEQNLPTILSSLGCSAGATEIQADA